MRLGDLEEIFEVAPASLPIPEPYEIEDPDEEELEPKVVEEETVEEEADAEVPA